ncbi:MAG: hypothetical protein L0229_18925, partial [Blastocatellia bacterium]|nr:hypothetical protein [Blastocatellia bacterium]
LLIENTTDYYPMKLALSPARLQRIWETTKLFWKEVQLSMGEQVKPISPRLRIKAELKGDALGVSHSYELGIENLRLSIICVKEGEFLTAENLLRFARLLNAPEEYQKDYCTAAMYVHDRLQGREFPIEEPTGYGSSNKQRGKITIKEVTPEATPYVPAIPILAEPRNFMVLVPANKALDVVDAIKKKYEVEMGKVRNRLPLTVGAVFSGSRTPLAALLDSGRRILNIRSKEEDWKISSIADEAQHRVLNFEVADKSNNPALTKKLTWRVPIKMGDGVTDDQWYPYFFTDAALGTYQRMFQSPDGNRYLVHVGDLRGDGSEEIKAQPSFFDFEFLDSAAQRFEISYENGRRRGRMHPARPYYLEQVDDFKKVWKMLSAGLATSQVKTLNELIETKRREWFEGLDAFADEQRKQEKERRWPVFEQFVKDALNNAGWKKGKRPASDDFCYLLRTALCGQLADVVEMFMKIQKFKTEVDGDEKQ